MDARGTPKRKTMTLRGKIFLSFTVLLLLTSTLMFAFIRYAEDQIQQVYFTHTMESLKAESSALSQQINAIQGSMATMCINSTFNGKLEEYLRGGSDTPKVQTTAYFSEALEELLGTHDLVAYAFLCTPKGTFYSLTQESLRKGRVEDDPALASMLSSTGSAMHAWGSAMDNGLYNTPGKVVPLIMTYRQRVLGDVIQLVVLLDENALYRKVNPGGTSSRYVILNAEGAPVALARDDTVKAVTEDPVWREQLGEHRGELWESRVNGKSFLFVSTSIVGNTRWTLVGVSDRETLLGKLNNFGKLMMGIMAVCVAICFVMAFRISRAITKPLYRLRDTMGRVAERDFDVSFAYRYDDVVGDLGDSFNSMVLEIRNLIARLNEQKEQVRVQQLLKRRAELKALQAQINPHFLYNTLDSISWMALDAGADEISDIAVALADLFRSGLKRGNELSPLEDEITHVSSYMKIQKMRYEDRTDYEIDVPEELRRFYCIRLLLQPLAENSIYHGIKPGYRKGMIRIGGERDGDVIRLWVRDNGVGMTPEDMAEINRKLRAYVVVDKAGYGIFNVNERIHLYFGEPYGLCYSREGEWTAATLTIPKVEQGDLERYVQYFDCR